MQRKKSRKHQPTAEPSNQNHLFAIKFNQHDYRTFIFL